MKEKQKKIFTLWNKFFGERVETVDVFKLDGLQVGLKHKR